MKKLLRTDITGMMKGIIHPPKHLEIYVCFVSSGNFDEYVTDTGEIKTGKLIRDLEDGHLKIEW